MNYKRLFTSQDRYIGKFKGWRIFLSKYAKYYAIKENEKTHFFNNRKELNKWIVILEAEKAEKRLSQQPELFWRQFPVVDLRA